MMRVKCPHCNGKGVSELNSALNMVCGWCMGKGELDIEIVPKEPMTNEEYIRSCSTEELPKALKEMFFDIKSRVRSELGGYNELMKSERYFDEWLKEKRE